MPGLDRPPLRVQSLLFDKRHGWTDADARRWLGAHGYRASSADVTANYLRYRQLDPSAFDRASFATVVYGDGVEAVMAKPLKGNPMARRTPRRDSKGRFLKSGKSKSRKGARKSRRSSKRKSSRRGRKHSSSGKTVHVKRGSRVTIVAT